MAGRSSTRSDEREKIPVHLIVPSPTNPRKTFDPVKLQELADSILNKGLIQPIVVRRRKYYYELVAGERRWRAHKLAEISKIDAIIRDLTDKDVAEIQVIENEQRDDVAPLQKAEGYAHLIKRHGYTVESVAAKVGKSPGTVYGLLKLRDLPENAALALEQGILPMSTAQLIARIPTEADRSIAASQILHSPSAAAGEPLSFRASKELIETRFTRELKGAPFDRKALDLVPDAGACGPCPKRAGNMGEANGRADVCTDVTCFRKKAEANEQKLLAGARMRGIAPMFDPHVKRWFDADGKLDPSRQFVDLDQPFDNGKRGKKLTYLQLCNRKKLTGILGQGGCAIAVVDPLGRLRTLAPAIRVQHALEASGLVRAAATGGNGADVPDPVPAPSAAPPGPSQYAIRTKAALVLAGEVAEEMGCKKIGAAPVVYRALEAVVFAQAIKAIGDDGESILAERIGDVNAFPDDAGIKEALDGWIGKRTAAEHLQFLVELLAYDAAVTHTEEFAPVRERLATFAKTSWPECLRIAERELRAPAAPEEGEEEKVERNWERVEVGKDRLEPVRGDIAKTNIAGADQKNGLIKVRHTFAHGGKLMVSGCGVHGPDRSEAECYHLMPRHEFKGETWTGDRKLEIKKPGDTYPGDWARNDPNGVYHGFEATHRGQPFVLCGPPIVFFSVKAKRKKPDVDDDVDAEQMTHSEPSSRNAEDAGEGDKCRGCGCTEDNACLDGPTPCYWVEPGLCSSCVANNVAEPTTPEGKEMVASIRMASEGRRRRKEKAT